MICFPLNNTAYEANALGAWLGTRTRGVYAADDNLAVLAGDDGMHVTLRPGLAWLKRDNYWGTMILQDAPIQFTLDPADGVLSRIDTVVLQLDKDNNLAQPLIRSGSFDISPACSAPVRDAHVDEIIVASILIQPGAVDITQADITDLRLNETYCGLMRDGVTGLPTAALHAQWASFFAQVQQDTADRQQQADAAFAAWFQRMKELFAEDPPGSLQTQIDALQAQKADVSTVTDALAGKAPAVHTHTKAEVGLGNVDNTPDSEKSVLYAASAGSAVDQTARNTANSASTAAGNAQAAANAKMPKSGGAFTGNISVPANYAASGLVKNSIVLNSGWGDTGQNTSSIYFIRK